MEWTLRKLAKEFYSTISHTNAESTVNNYRRYIDAFIKAVKNKPIAELKPLDLIKWGRTWHQIQAVQRLFGWAVNDVELLTKHPFRNVPKPPTRERTRTLNKKQLAQLLRAAQRCFREFLIGMRETIARPQEIRELRWDWLSYDLTERDLETALGTGNAFFVLTEYKSRKRRKQPSKPRLLLVSKRLGRLLLRLLGRGKQKSGYVFVNSKGHPWTGNAVRLRMRNLRKRLGLGPNYLGEQIVAYSLRHTQATMAAAKGIRDRLLAEIMGHTTTRTTARYQHLETDHLREAFGKLAPRIDREVKKKLPSGGN